MHTPMYKNIYTKENIEAFVSIHTNSASGLRKYPLNCKSNRAPSLQLRYKLPYSSLINIVYMNLHLFCNTSTAHLARLFSTACKT